MQIVKVMSKNTMSTTEANKYFFAFQEDIIQP